MEDNTKVDLAVSACMGAIVTHRGPPVALLIPREVTINGRRVAILDRDMAQKLQEKAKFCVARHMWLLSRGAVAPSRGPVASREHKFSVTVLFSVASIHAGQNIHDRQGIPLPDELRLASRPQDHKRLHKVLQPVVGGSNGPHHSYA